MKDKSIIRSCKALAGRACANFSNHYCLPEDRACHLINTRYPAIHDGAIDCDYFITAVLSGDKELHRLVLSSCLIPANVLRRIRATALAAVNATCPPLHGRSIAPPAAL